MRLLSLTNFYPPHDLGGLEQLCQEWGQALERRGHEVHVLTSRYVVRRDTRPGDDDPRVERSLYLETDPHFYRPWHFLTRHPAESRANLETLRQAIDRIQPDLLIVWGMWQLSWQLPYLAERCMPGRVVYYLASYWPTDADPHTTYWNLPARRAVTERIKKPLRRLAFSRLQRMQLRPPLAFEHAICVSEYVRDALAQFGRIHAADVIYCTVESGIAAAPRTPGTSEPLQLAYFGRIIPDKGVHTAIEAMAALVRQGHGERVRLTIVGSGHPGYEADLRRMVDELQLQAHVRFVGRQPLSELTALLAGFDVFVSTSIWPEPFARTLLLSMLAGLIVVASDAGGTRELMRMYDESLLFPPGDALALADRIRRVLDDRIRYTGLIERGRTLVLDRFTTEPVIHAVERFLDARVRALEGAAGRQSVG